jgi:hypothetical protein
MLIISFFSELFSVRPILCLSRQAVNESQNYSSLSKDKLNLAKLLVRFSCISLSTSAIVNLFLMWICNSKWSLLWSTVQRYKNWSDGISEWISWDVSIVSCEKSFSCHYDLGHVNLATLKLWLSTFLEECVHKWQAGSSVTCNSYDLFYYQIKFKHNL